MTEPKKPTTQEYNTTLVDDAARTANRLRCNGIDMPNTLWDAIVAFSDELDGWRDSGKHNAPTRNTEKEQANG